MKVDVLDDGENDQKQIERQISESAREPQKGDVDPTILGDGGDGEAHVRDSHSIIAGGRDDLVPTSRGGVKTRHVLRGRQWRRVAGLDSRGIVIGANGRRNTGGVVSRFVYVTGERH